MNIDEAVGFYHSLEHFGINPGLERIKALCEELGNPQRNMQFVHVAGTNGKGSTCTEIASVLTKAGYQTGLYTSPYVIDFRERVQINGEMIAKEELIAVTQTVKNAVDSLNERGIFPTEFEAVTAAAFLYYRRKNCDVVVLETGLGGRFDATNIIEKPLVSVIVSVSLDHVGILGDTCAKIAFEKCGIIKRGCPTVTSVHQLPEVLSVIKENCLQKDSRLITADDDAMFAIQNEDITGTDVLYQQLSLHIPFPGAHQTENASLCVSVCQILKNKGYHITNEALQSGLACARIPARTEMLHRNPPVILDGSHNEGSTLALSVLLKKYMSGKKVLAVMGMMADKDCETVLQNLLPSFDYVIAVTPSNPRAMRAQDFLHLVQRNNKQGMAINSPTDGVKKALELINQFDALVVCGSLYLASDVRETLINLLSCN